MTFAALYLLASVDGLLLGYRAAIGRNPLVNKRRYWARALLRGFVAGQIALAIIGAAVFLALRTTVDPDGFLADAAVAGGSMLRVYVPYALLVLPAIALYMTPFRVLANVLVLGPFTLLRAPVLVLGLAAGVAARPRWEIGLVLLVSLAATASLRPLLQRFPPAW